MSFDSEDSRIELLANSVATLSQTVRGLLNAINQMNQSSTTIHLGLLEQSNEHQKLMLMMLRYVGEKLNLNDSERIELCGIISQVEQEIKRVGDEIIKAKTQCLPLLPPLPPGLANGDDFKT